MFSDMSLTRLLINAVILVHVAFAAKYTVATQKRYGAMSPAHIHDEFDEDGHWYATGFKAGNSKNLEFLIDTGSSDCIIGTAYYHKGPNGSYTGKNFTIVYYPDPKANSLHGEIYQDSLTFTGLTVAKQDLGIFPSNRTGRQGGLIGFAGIKNSALHRTGWFYNLCDEKKLDECRFGLAFGTNATGKQVLGSVDNSLFSGELTVAPRESSAFEFWGVRSDVMIGNKIVDKNAVLVLDSGTDRIFAPLPRIRAIFDMVGYTYKYHAGNPKNPRADPSYVHAEFPCDTKLQLGFSIPSAQVYASSKHSGNVSKPRVFEIGQSYWGPPIANGNCTSILWGSNQFTRGLKLGLNTWLVGQAFHEGHYMDHNAGGHSMGFAVLKNKQNP